MLALTLSLLLSQSHPPASPEMYQQFETEHGPLLAALSEQYGCKKPRKTPEPMCDVALALETGAAPDLRGQSKFVGLTWRVKRGKRGKLDVGAPQLSAVLLNKDSVGVWGALIDITPQNAVERKQLTKLTKDFEALFRGRKATVKLTADIPELLEVGMRFATVLVEKKDNAWVFKGIPGGLRKVGERWVMIGVPRMGDGILVSVYAP